MKRDRIVPRAAHAETRHGLDLKDEFGASDYLRVSVKTLRNWRCTGVGPRFRKLGALVRYDRADLDAFASLVVKGGADPSLK